MSSLEVNKAFAAVLTAGIAFMVTGVVGKSLVHAERPEKSAIQIGEAVAVAAAPAAAAPAPLEPIGPLLASASVANGQTLAQRQCASCHSFNQGGRNGVGPNLYGTIGAKHAHVEGFAYSAALKAKGNEPWTNEAMNAWLLKPSAYAAGTKMAFAGINNTAQRADVVAYLRSISPDAPAE